ncbi:MAG: cation transporter [Lachnospiraceae bacterium]|nr:cation transporter [Lachnospiraceae bacterium]
MITLLAKIFIKNDNYKDMNVREKYGKLCGIVGIFLNVMLCFIKFFAGIMTGAIAITADAFNNLSDAASSLVTLIGFKLARNKADSKHPFGHGRIEYISGLVVSFLILLMAYELIKNSVIRIIHPVLPEADTVTFIILLFSILVKLYMAYYNSSMSKKLSSVALKATAKDSLSDVGATSVVLISVIGAYMWKLPLDGFGGLIVGIMILFAGISAFKDTVDPLLGKAPDEELIKEIENIVMSDERILGMHDLIVHDYGPGNMMVSLHVEVPYKEDILKLHELIDRIEYDLRGVIDCEPIIHMDPVVDDDDEVNKARECVEKVIASLGDDVTYHDFHVIKNDKNLNLIFDVVIPHGYGTDDDELKDEISDKLRKMDDRYLCIIQIDKK